MAYYFLGHPV